MHNQKNYFTLVTYTNRGTAHLAMANTLETSAPVGKSPILYGTDYKFLDRNSVWLPPKACKFLHQNSISANIYKSYLNLGLSELETKINDLFTLATVRLDKLVVISTHFAVAQQISKIHKKIENQNECKLIHIVIVTENSFKKLWCIPNADIIFLPSKNLKKEFEEQCRHDCNFEVLPYPVNKSLLKDLSKENLSKRKDISQSISRDIKVIHNLEKNNSFDASFVNLLMSGYKSYEFTFVSESSHDFNKFSARLNKDIDYSVINTHSDTEDITQYTRRLATEAFDIEISVCDEKIFKSLLNPTQAGGVVQFITKPVYKEHKDNYKFLEENGLVPDSSILLGMWKKAEDGKPPSKTMLDEAKKWRVLMMPGDPRSAAKFFNWAIRQNIVQSMMDYKNISKDIEMSQNGTKLFWERIEDFYIGEL